MPSLPGLSDLNQPANVKTVLSEEQKPYDCTPCRLMGSAAFTGMGIYSYASGMRQLREREVEILRSGTRFGIAGRRTAIWLLSGGLVGLGIYRLFN